MTCHVEPSGIWASQVVVDGSLGEGASEKFYAHFLTPLYRPQNDLLCVGWDVKPTYSLLHIYMYIICTNYSNIWL